VSIREAVREFRAEWQEYPAGGTILVMTVVFLVIAVLGLIVALSIATRGVFLAIFLAVLGISCLVYRWIKKGPK
jgi:hypothetical protein